MPDGTTHTHDFFEAAKAIVAEQAARQAARGTNLHGWASEPVRVESVSAVADRLAATHERALRFRASPRGRFLQAVEAIEETRGYDAESYRLRAYYNGSISALNGPTLTVEGVAAVAECIGILTHIVGRDARAGVDALVDLLRDEAPMLARAA